MSVEIAKESTKSFDSLTVDREVTRCASCGLVQFMTNRGNCRRCVRPLPRRVEVLSPHAVCPGRAVDNSARKIGNTETVNNIGQRIRQLRESRDVTQSELQSSSKVSRSYLSRIESGQMTPGLGTLEKIAEALHVGLNQFFMAESEGEGLFQDRFIQELRPFLYELDWQQWQSILKRLQAIGEHVNTPPVILRPIGKQVGTPLRRSAEGNRRDYVGTGHSNKHALMRPGADSQNHRRHVASPAHKGAPKHGNL